eukprot:TRINITY_DN37132_c0_g1_i1.p1 TRINITY_DN37132_c0_g1~~TRINITY_DN37132_c0_g1_i1.p1  ORF type:complete len:461 (+),score=79.95 TRINITY_DN37132_c0_g1_i1:66-1448(+)
MALQVGSGQYFRRSIHCWLQRGAVASTASLTAPRCTRQMCSDSGFPQSAVPPRMSHRVEDRLYRQQSEGADMQVPRDSALRLKLSREHRPLTEEQKALLRSVKNCSDSLDYEGALAALAQIPADGGLDWLPIWRAVLHCCCKALRYNEAHSVWQRIPSRDAMSYNSMMGMSSRLHRFDEVESLLQQMDREGVARTGVTYCQLISSCSESHRWTEALELLAELKATPALDPSTSWDVAYLVSMTACSRAQQPEQARNLLNEVIAMSQQGKVKVHNSHYNAMIVSCGNNVPAAEAVFAEMKAAGLQPRAPDWRALISCTRDCKEQQRLYGKMREEFPMPPGTKPLEEVWAILLRTALNMDDRDGVDWILEEMKRHGVEPQSQAASPALRRALRMYASRQHQEQVRQSYQNTTSFGSAPPLTEAAPAPLPSGWASAVDPNSGNEYYWRSDNPAGTTTWERPVA